MRFTSLYIIFVFCVGNTAWAQYKTDSTQVLDEIRVTAPRWTKLAGYKQIKVDSISKSHHLHGSLAQLLETNASLFIKSYGISGLATPSFRGTGSSHTQVYWEGFNINSPMLGQVDLSLIPVAATENIYLDFGGASLQHGTGGMGGSIMLDSRPDFTQGLNGYASSMAGSFGMLGTNAYLQGGNEKWQSVSKIYVKSANNDFNYLNSDREWQEMPNAQSSHAGFVQDIYVKTDKAGIFSIKTWAQQSHRQIQPPITVRQTDEELTDRFVRLAGGWEKNTSQSSIKIGAAYFDESMEYVKPMAGLRSTNHVRSLKFNSRLNHRISDQILLSTGVDASTNRAEAGVYDEIKHQNRITYFGGIEKEGRIFTGSFLLRQEWIDSTQSGLLPSLGLALHLPTALGELSISSAVHRNFRALTLNESFWAAEVGRSVLPEESWSAEFSVGLLQVRENLSLRQDATLFSNWVNNWILWRPGMPSWRPENIQQVWARGFEYTLGFSSVFGAFEQKLQASYTYTQSTSRYAVHGLDNSANRQLIFIPEHEARADWYIQKKKNAVGISQGYVSQRFVSSDHTAWLPAYLLTDFWLSHRFALQAEKMLVARVTLRNAFGYNYQVIPNYAMPGRYYEFSISYHFNNRD